jgi:hypothetical protein
MAKQHEYTFSSIAEEAKYILPYGNAALVYYKDDDYIGVEGNMMAGFLRFLTGKEPTDIFPDFYELKRPALAKTEDGRWRIFREVEISTWLEVANGQPIIRANVTAKALSKEE